MELESDLSIGALRARYERILDRVAEACSRSGRNPLDVTVVAVSKTFSDRHVRALYDMGHRDFGESRVQEFLSKQRAIGAAGGCVDLRWHLIGHLQRNKVKDVIGLATLIHSVDSLRLAEELDRRASDTGRTVDVLVQVNISRESSKFGLEPEAAPGFFRDLYSLKNLVPRGLMGMAMPVNDPEDVRSEFALLRNLSESLNVARTRERMLTTLSMGMSDDFEVAVEEGATHVRIGSAIFGSR